MSNKTKLSGKKVFWYFAIFFVIIFAANIFLVYKAVETKPEVIETK